MAAFYFFTGVSEAADGVLLPRVANQNYVGVGMPTDHRQLFSIKRPMEVVNIFGSKISNLFALRPIERLRPEIVHPILAGGINHSLAVAREPHQPESRTFELHKLGLPR